jgi:hypothetical protein
MEYCRTAPKSYARNDPVDLIDPSGKGFFTWLMDALLILADIFTGGATTPESIQWGISMEGIRPTLVKTKPSALMDRLINSRAKSCVR